MSSLPFSDIAAILTIKIYSFHSELDSGHNEFYARAFTCFPSW